MADLELPTDSPQAGWASTYGGADPDRAYLIHQTKDEGYIVAGWTDSFGAGNRDFWVLKLRPDGAVEWQKTYGGDNFDEAHSIHQTGDGGYIVAGWTMSFGAEDLWVLKLKTDGSVEWQKTYGGDDTDEANYVHQTRDGGYIVAGRTRSFGAGAFDFWILKLRPDGAVEWEKTYGGDDWDEAHSIHQTRDEGYIVAGWTGSFVPGGQETPDLWVLKLKADGAVEWQKTYGGDDWDGAHSIQQTSEGGYIVVGETRSFGAGDGDFWVLKLKADGAVEWQKTYGGSYWDGAYSIQQTRDEGYIVAGNTDSFSAGDGDFWVLKLRPNGSIDPSCNFIKDTSTSGKDSSAAARTTRSARDSQANPKDSSATVLDTNVSANILCPATAVKGPYQQ